MIPKRANIDIFLAQQRRSLRQTLRHFPASRVEETLGELSALVDGFQSAKETIEADERLTTVGKEDATLAEAKKALEAIRSWGDKTISGYDGHISSVRAQLLNADKSEIPDRQLDALIARMQQLTPLETTILYGAASPAEQRAMERASTEVGRLPTRNEDGSLQWNSMLDPGQASEGLLSRASEANPRLAAELGDLLEIRSSVSTLVEVAKNNVKDATNRDWTETSPQILVN